MKIRVIGTKDECKQAALYYNEIGKEQAVKYISVSGFYPCRNSLQLFRVYIDIEYYGEAPRMTGKLITD